MNFQDYKAHKALNLSLLVEMEKSPAHFKWAQDHKRDDTESLKVGRLIHCMILTPSLVNDEYIQAPICDRRTKEGKEIYAEFLKVSEGKEVISLDQFNECQRIADSVLSSPKIKAMLQNGEAEKSYFWNLNGVEMKSRLDFVSNIILDLKTCQDARPEQFAKDCIKYKYDVKLSAYQIAVEQITGEKKPVIILAVEKSPPYAFQVHYLNDDWMRIGREKLSRLINLYKECLEKNDFPSYSHNVNELTLPSWVK